MKVSLGFPTALLGIFISCSREETKCGRRRTALPGNWRRNFSHPYSNLSQVLCHSAFPVEANTACRSQTRQEILRKLFLECKVGLVRGPPSSGKTSLGILLADLAQNQNFKVHLVSLLEWHRPTSITAFFRQLRLPIAEWKSLHNTIIIIDEAQKIYSRGPDHFFWRTVKLIQLSDGCCVLFLGMFGESRKQGGKLTAVTMSSFKKEATCTPDRPEKAETYCG